MSDLISSGFQPATHRQWRERVDAVLKGADFQKALVGRTHDGIEIQPLYPKAENAIPIVSDECARWRVSQRVDHPDPAKANELAMRDLEGGANALTLVTRGTASARDFGVTIRSVDNLDVALSGVMLDLIHLRLDAGLEGEKLAMFLAELADRRGHELADLSFDLGLDPIGAMATGRFAASPRDVINPALEIFDNLTARGFKGRGFLADGRPYHEAGASEAQELAAVLATGVAYLRALEAHETSVDCARKALGFLLVADADEFLTLAKFRALRRLWARVEEASRLAPGPIFLHAETAWRMTTRRDPWVNLLRTTVAAFAAGLGGADAVTILPFTCALGLPDAFARRTARNTQLILLEEAHLWRVSDPAAGAGGVEALTDALCEKAWALFQAIEGEGGIVENLKAGALQRRIATVRAQRENAIAMRREPITGTTEYPNLDEAAVAVLFPARTIAAASASLSEGEGPAMLLPSIRSAEPLERLRDVSDAWLARTGSRPKIFLANLGPAVAFTSRSTFAQSFFEAGGIECIASEALMSVDEIAAAFGRSRANAACLCSSDEVYFDSADDAIVPNETAVEEAARALVQGGCAYVAMAGRPIIREPSLRSAGIREFAYNGCNHLATLSQALGMITGEPQGGTEGIPS